MQRAFVGAARLLGGWSALFTGLRCNGTAILNFMRAILTTNSLPTHCSNVLIVTGSGALTSLFAHLAQRYCARGAIITVRNSARRRFFLNRWMTPGITFTVTHTLLRVLLAIELPTILPVDICHISERTLHWSKSPMFSLDCTRYHAPFRLLPLHTRIPAI